MNISIILNGCGIAKVNVGVHFKSTEECPRSCKTESGYVQPQHLCKKNCGSSDGTIMVYLDGKKIGETSDKISRQHKPKYETKVIEFEFHHGSKIEFILTAKINSGSTGNYGAAIKFNSFKNNECFSKCE